VRLKGKCVLCLTGDVPLLGDLFGSQAHAVRNAVVVHIVGVGEHGGRQTGRVAHHGHHAHAFHAGGNHHLGLTHPNAVGGHLYGAQARGAKAVDGDAADALGQTGQHRPYTRHVEALLGFRNGTTADHVFNGGGVEVGHLRQRRAQHVRQQVIRARVLEIPFVRLADGRASGRNDVGILNLFHELLRFNCL